MVGTCILWFVEAIRKNIYFGPEQNSQSWNFLTSLIAQHNCPIIVLVNIKETWKVREYGTWVTVTQEMNDFPPADNEMGPAALLHLFFIHINTALIHSSNPSSTSNYAAFFIHSTRSQSSTSLTIAWYFFMQDVEKHTVEETKPCQVFEFGFANFRFQIAEFSWSPRCHIWLIAHLQWSDRSFCRCFRFNVQSHNSHPYQGFQRRADSWGRRHKQQRCGFCKSSQELT